MNKIKLISIFFLIVFLIQFIQGMSETPDQMLLRGVKFGDLGVTTIEKAFKLGANINAINEEGDTALMILIKNRPIYGGITKVVKVLMDHGPNLYIKDREGKSLVDLAKLSNNQAIMNQIFTYIVSKSDIPDFVNDLYPIIGEYAFDEQLFNPDHRLSLKMEQKDKISEEDKNRMMADFIDQIEERAGVSNKRKRL